MVNRSGFGLVEAVVAMTLVGVGVMSIAAGATFSTRLLRIGENEEDASRIGEALIDSISHASVRSAGAADIDRFHAQWTVSLTEVQVDVVLRDPPDNSPVTLRLDLLPRMDTIPCGDCDE
jgi:Tfp pilus assembly protein PilV